MVASIIESPVLIGLLPALLGIALGYLGYRQSQKVDQVAEQAGIETLEQGSISQVISALNQLNDKLQRDNEIGRVTIDRLNEKLDKILVYVEELKLEITELKKVQPNVD
jgi:archaellum component FlaC